MRPRAEGPASASPSTRRSTRRSSPATARSRRGTTSARPDSARECLRQIQYDYLAVPKDEGREFEPSTLRVFEAGHRAEDVVAAWLRAAGFDLRTQRQDGRQFGFSSLDWPLPRPHRWVPRRRPGTDRIPGALGEQGARRLLLEGGGQEGASCIARPIYAAQIALYQAYLDLPNPALFTALNRDTFELHCELVPFDAALAQRASDRAALVVRASEAQELLPRAAVGQELCALPRRQDRRRMARRLCLAGSLLEGAP